MKMPRLWRTHPNFFIAYFTVAMIHLFIGATSFLDHSRWDAPSLDLVFKVAPLWAWGLAHLGIWVLLTIGVYHRFSLYGRVGLALGLASCLCRGLLVEASSFPSGTGVALWVGVAVWQYTMTAEPPINPLTAKG